MACPTTTVEKDAPEREKLLSFPFHNSVAHYEPPSSCWFFYSIFNEKLFKQCHRLRNFAVELVETGKTEPRKVVFAGKMGIALMLISLLILLKEPFEGINQYPAWALLPVVVIFDFSIGATIKKGLARAFGAILAGGLALGMAALSTLMTGEWRIIFIVLSIFITGFCATYVKQIPSAKAHKHIFQVFVFIYCFIVVYGHTNKQFIRETGSMFLIMGSSTFLCWVLNICIYPVWAGNELHSLVVKNFMDLAASLEGCVNSYLTCIRYERLSSETYASHHCDEVFNSAYESALTSPREEDALVRCAMSEPPHWPCRMLQYPWDSYSKVTHALRQCAFVIISLHGCIMSEIQSTAGKRQLLHLELQSIGDEGAKVLRELGTKFKHMEKLGPVDILYEVQHAAEMLGQKIDQRLHLLFNFSNKEIRGRQQMEFQNIASSSHGSPASKMQYDFEQSDGLRQSPNVLNLITFASLLIEFVARLQNVVDAFEVLSLEANFRDLEIEESMNSFSERKGIWTKLQFSWKFLWSE